MKTLSTAILIIALSSLAACVSTPNEVVVDVRLNSLKHGVVTVCDTFKQAKSIFDAQKKGGQKAGKAAFDKLTNTTNEKGKAKCGNGYVTFMQTEVLATYMLDWGGEILPSAIVKMYVLPHKEPYYGLVYKRKAHVIKSLEKSEPKGLLI